jgi:hypothetical protein
MMRLGSLAGYPFEGPRLLAGWTAPAAPAVFAVLYRPRPEDRPQEYGVLYVGHSDDLSAEGFPFDHPAAGCWLQRVGGDRFALYVCTYQGPGVTRAHREHIGRELMAMYRPGCNQERYDPAWKDEWIGRYQAPTTGPLTTGRQPSGTD